jgi:hypothetical protein
VHGQNAPFSAFGPGISFPRPQRQSIRQQFAQARSSRYTITGPRPPLPQNTRMRIFLIEETEALNGHSPQRQISLREQLPRAENSYHYTITASDAPLRLDTRIRLPLIEEFNDSSQEIHTHDDSISDQITPGTQVQRDLNEHVATLAFALDVLAPSETPSRNSPIRAVDDPPGCEPRAFSQNIDD